MNEGSRLSEDLNICNILIRVASRPAGFTVEQGYGGRRKNGLVYIRSGEELFRDTDGKETIAGTGDLVFIPKFKTYQMRYNAEQTAFVLIDFDLLDKNGENVPFMEDISILTRDDAFPALAQIMSELEECGASETLSAAFRRKELCYRLFSEICAFCPISRSGEGKFPQIAQGVHLLEQTFLENLPIQCFADASHIGSVRFRELFRKQFGMSPVKYRNRLRIERAKELLLEEHLTTAEIAYACGFENVSYFCKYYRRETGETPTETKRKKR